MSGNGLDYPHLKQCHCFEAEY